MYIRNITVGDRSIPVEIQKWGQPTKLVNPKIGSNTQSIHSQIETSTGYTDTPLEQKNFTRKAQNMMSGTLPTKGDN